MDTRCNESHTESPEYSSTYTKPGLPGLYFDCQRLSATLRVETCTRMWSQAQQHNAPEGLHRCKDCAVGAVRAGHPEKARPDSPFGGRICRRCHRPNSRISPGSLLCVSCLNRQHEIAKGRNACGGFPSRLPALHVRMAMVRLPAGDELRTLGPCRDVLEVIVAAMQVLAPRLVVARRVVQPKVGD